MAKKPKKVFFVRLAARRIAPTKESSQKIYRKIFIFSQKRPITAFLMLLFVLLLALSVGRTLNKAPEAPKAQTTQKEVAIYKVGQSPKLTVNARVEKSQVIEIVALSSAIVSKVNVQNGQNVKKGANLISMSSNYQGGNSASVQRQIAQEQFKSAKDNFDIQNQIIQKQHEIADKTDTNADDLREITSKSLDETKSQISQNQNILSSLDQSIASLEATNVGGVNDAAILQAKGQKSQFLVGLNQSQAALRQSEFQASSDKTPAQLSNLSRELTQKQLDLQKNQLKTGLDIAALQLKLAAVSEAAMFPNSPFGTKVEKVHVKVGDLVNPGTPLVTISGNENVTTAHALVPQTIANSVSKTELAIVTINNKQIELPLSYASKEATNSQLYSIVVEIPKEVEKDLTQDSTIQIDIPLAAQKSDIPFVPLDAIHQTQEETTLYIKQDNMAKSRKITLGTVQGNFVEVTSGLDINDEVIVNRNVTEGDKVSQPKSK